MLSKLQSQKEPKFSLLKTVLSGIAVVVGGAALAAKVAHVDGKFRRHVKRTNRATLIIMVFYRLCLCYRRRRHIRVHIRRLYPVSTAAAKQDEIQRNCCMNDKPVCISAVNVYVLHTEYDPRPLALDIFRISNYVHTYSVFFFLSK